MKDIPQPRKRPRQARSQHTVDVILDAAALVLAKGGYAGTNTNLVAERAGVSVGSVYQYFPNKDALVVALHERHARQMYEVIDAILSAAQTVSVRDHVAAIAKALLAAHMIEPELHKVLERDLVFFDRHEGECQSDRSIFLRIRGVLEDLKGQIVPTDYEFATWIVLNLIVSMVHATVIEPPEHFVVADIEQAIVEAVMGYLVGAAGSDLVI